MKNDVTSFFYYMWNKWSEAECIHIFGKVMGDHFWAKWCDFYDRYGSRAAIDCLYAAMSDNYRGQLVARALELYDGQRNK